MPQNYILLERIELASAAASVVFNNIPQSGYTDLKIVMSARNSLSSTDATYVLRLNSADGTSRVLYANGSVTGSLSSSTVWGYVNASTSTASTFSNAEIYLPNYTSSSAKSVSIDNVDETNATNIAMSLAAGLFSTVTSGVTSLSILACDNNQTNNQTFLQYSTFSLYGLAATGTTPVIAPKATGGNLIENDGTYWIHTFTSTGAFTPLTGLTCDYLVVAGGGGGGQGGGGGGAGGYRTSIGGSPLSVASGTAYTITVGAGGSSSNSTSNPPVPTNTAGSNSVFSTITSTGGGRGGSYDSTPGGNGGSGGGGSDAGFGTASPSGQGNNGGTGTFVTGGGGGGANAVGGNGAGVGGNGGNGLSNSISGSSVTYAGGGGGGSWSNQGAAGTGGTGGGGNGTANTSTAQSGGTNLGGGGGGAGFAQVVPAFGISGAGGSGIVIIRYPIA